MILHWLMFLKFSVFGIYTPSAHLHRSATLPLCKITHEIFQWWRRSFRKRLFTVYGTSLGLKLFCPPSPPPAPLSSWAHYFHCWVCWAYEDVLQFELLISQVSLWVTQSAVLKVLYKVTTAPDEGERLNDEGRALPPSNPNSDLEQYL